MIQTNKPMMFSFCKDTNATKYYEVIIKYKNFDFISFYEFISIQKGPLFDSSMGSSTYSNWSFFGIQPSKKLSSSINNKTDFLEQIQAEIFNHKEIPKEINDLPFIAGYMGFISYEKSFENLNPKKPTSSTFPEYQFEHYDGSITLNHKTNEIIVVTSDLQTYESILDQYQKYIFCKSKTTKKPVSISKAKPQLMKADYLQKIKQILENIKCGNIYQANFTHKLIAEFHGNPIELYKSLRRFNPSPYSCYYQVSEDLFILSSSPERLFKIEQNIITSNPIKGTIKRDANPARDKTQKKILLNSPKDRAELTMIVDLIRNDLGRICEFGSITVNQWPTLETFQKVHHLVGEIQGKLNPKTTLNQIFSSIFPGGSITGAPKIRSMEIIDKIEDSSRGPYTGSIGYIDLRGNMEFNILIRTILIEKNKLTLQVGGGIVADSDPKKEYEETMHKAEAILDALNHFELEK
ncbi:MAG: aminodeoxychorismate synthase, component I [Planctomycetota bacterium]|nr:MAG: aminodeoxychorismate synthase, component I [Planctomycetota bacterium]